MSGKHSKRVPADRDLKAIQDERLTCRHIQTLMALQQSADENEELKSQIQMLKLENSSCQELHKAAHESTRRIEEIRKDLMHESDVKIKNLKASHQKELNFLREEEQRRHQLDEERLEKMQMLIESLEIEMEAKSKEIEKYLHRNYDLEELKEDLKSTTLNLSRVENENKSLKGRVSELQNDNSRISAEKVKTSQKLRELESTLKSMESKLDAEIDSKRRLVEQNDLLKDITDLRESLNILEKDNKEKTRVVEELTEYNQVYQKKIFSLEKSISFLELERDAMNQSSIDLRQEVEYLKSKDHRSGDKSFTEYVKLKREFVSLKEENLKLKSLVPKAEFKTLKADGKMTGKISTSRKISKRNNDSKIS